jgi:hypothetical protein
MSKSLFKQPLFYTTVLSLLALGLIIASYVFGWNPPTQPPPNGNITLQTGASPAGSAGYIQFNAGSGALGGDANLFWDNTNKRLGIGTTGPVGTLHLKKDNYRQLVLQRDNSSTMKSEIEWLDQTGTSQFKIGIDYANNLSRNWYLWDSVSSAYRLFIDSSGNVGIGTTTPSEKLEVAGNIKLSGSSPTYKITNVAAPTASSDVATMGYVDAATAGVKYWSIQATTTAYNGNLDGYPGYLAICQSAFGTGAIPFSSLMLSNALRGSVVIAINYDVSKTYWWEALSVSNDPSVGGGATTSGGIPPASPKDWYFSNNTTSTDSNCAGWTNNSTSYWGSTFSPGSSGGSALGSCNSTYALLCAVPN